VQYIGRVDVFETAQYLVQEVADVIVAQSLVGEKKKNEDLWQPENASLPNLNPPPAKIYHRLMMGMDLREEMNRRALELSSLPNLLVSSTICINQSPLNTAQCKHLSFVLC
jgi:hypothetical protein